MSTGLPTVLSLVITTLGLISLEVIWMAPEASASFYVYHDCTPHGVCRAI